MIFTIHCSLSLYMHVPWSALGTISSLLLLHFFLMWSSKPYKLGNLMHLYCTATSPSDPALDLYISSIYSPLSLPCRVTKELTTEWSPDLSPYLSYTSPQNIGYTNTAHIWSELIHLLEVLKPPVNEHPSFLVVSGLVLYQAQFRTLIDCGQWDSLCVPIKLRS